MSVSVANECLGQFKTAEEVRVAIENRGEENSGVIFERAGREFEFS